MGTQLWISPPGLLLEMTLEECPLYNFPHDEIQT
jgi:hypothetical protein